MKAYVMRFTQFSKCLSSIVANSTARIPKFVMGVAKLVMKECHTTIFVHDMDISFLVVHFQ